MTIEQQQVKMQSAKPKKSLNSDYRQAPIGTRKTIDLTRENYLDRKVNSSMISPHKQQAYSPTPREVLSKQLTMKTGRVNDISE